MTGLDELAGWYRQLSIRMAELSERFPGATVVRSQVGNLSIIADDRYVGWIDVLTGEVEIFD